MAVLLLLILVSNNVYSINPPICNSIEFEWNCSNGICQSQSSQPVNVCAGSKSGGWPHSTIFYCQNNQIWRKQWNTSETCQGTPYQNDQMADVIIGNSYYGDYTEACDLGLCDYVKLSIYSNYNTQPQCENQGRGIGVDYYDEMHINNYCIGLENYGGQIDNPFSLKWVCSGGTVSQESWSGLSNCSNSKTTLYTSSIGNGICTLYDSDYNYKNIECGTGTSLPTLSPTSHPTTTNPTTFAPTTENPTGGTASRTDALITDATNSHVQDKDESIFIGIILGIIGIILGSIGISLLIAVIVFLCLRNKKQKQKQIKHNSTEMGHISVVSPGSTDPTTGDTPIIETTDDTPMMNIIAIVCNGEGDDVLPNSIDNIVIGSEGIVTKGSINMLSEEADVDDILIMDQDENEDDINIITPQ